MRFRLHDDPVHPFSEAIGVIQGVRDTDGRVIVSILSKRGEVASIPADDILAAKLFPLD